MNSRQQGQALPLGLALILFGVLGGLVLYNTGQSATDKTRLANAADAAAYSGVLWQARALNFQSYTNRAMVANQVTIGQAVSIQSWSRYALITAENFATVTAAIPFLNAITRGLEKAASTLDTFLVPIGKAMVAVVDGVNGGLSASQDAIFSSSFAATPDIVKAVAETYDTRERFTAETGYSVSGLYRNLNEWSSFTDEFSPEDIEDRPAMRERMKLVGESADPFTESRDWELFSPRLYTTPLTSHQITRRGRTDLIEVEGPNGELHYEWKAKDTLQLENEFQLLIKTVKVDVPIGWAEALVNKNGADTIEVGAGCRWASRGFFRRGRTVCGAAWFPENEAAERFADNNAAIGIHESLIKSAGYTGIQAFRSLSEATLNDRDPKLMLRVEVAMDSDKIRDSGKLVSGQRFRAPVVTPGALLSSISIAEVYYQRPDVVTADVSQSRARPLEYANGYNPYWDVRLSSIPERERLLALALRPGGLSTSIPDGLDVANAGSELGSYVEDDPLVSTLANADDVVRSGTDGLADAYGVSDYDALRSDVVVYANGTIGNVGSMLAQLDVEVPSADDIKGKIESELRDQLDDSLTRILEGIVGSNAGRDIQGTINDLKAEASELKGEIPLDLDSLEEFKESEVFLAAKGASKDFKALNQEVSEEFGPIAKSAIETADLIKAPLLARLAQLRSIGDFGAIHDIEYQLRVINRQLVIDLSNELVATMTDFGIEWSQNYKTTRSIIRQMLDDYYGSDQSGQLGWELPPDEEEPVPVRLETEETAE